MKGRRCRYSVALTIRTGGHVPALDIAALHNGRQGVALNRRRRHESAAGAAVTDLFEQHGRMVYGLCRMLLGSREEAEDAAQQTFLSAYRTLARGGSYREPAAWLAAIARNECRRRHGRRRLDVVPLGDFEPSGGAGPDSLAIEREELDALRRALTELPNAQRQAIVLREFYGFSYEEVAAALDRSGRAVESLLFKSRRTLNAQLQPLRDAAGALVLPATLRDSLINLISGLQTSPGAAAAGAGGIAATKVLGLPASAKIAALLAAGAAATGLATEAAFDGSHPARPTEPQAHGHATAKPPGGPTTRTGPASAPVLFAAPTERPSPASLSVSTRSTSAAHSGEHKQEQEHEQQQQQQQEQPEGASTHATDPAGATGEHGDSSSGTETTVARERPHTTEAQPVGTQTGETASPDKPEGESGSGGQDGSSGSSDSSGSSSSSSSSSDD